MDATHDCVLIKSGGDRRVGKRVSDASNASPLLLGMSGGNRAPRLWTVAVQVPTGMRFSLTLLETSVSLGAPLLGMRLLGG